MEIATLNSAVKDVRKDTCGGYGCSYERGKVPCATGYGLTIDKVDSAVQFQWWGGNPESNPFIQGGPAYKDGSSELEGKDDPPAYLSTFVDLVGLALSRGYPVAGTAYSAANIALGLDFNGEDKPHSEEIRWTTDSSPEGTYAISYRYLQVYIPKSASSGTIEIGTETRTGTMVGDATLRASEQITINQ
ncbi:hypothetical protein M0R88_04330 [Halorussus gelatinilyticus]|uniref:Uncharacterized protein n=1 Tax=Halorussus gelatinilyticus TaxID=2937524 RepID=A0A8U0IKZ6_9EURY|nr:hypothetical protein [Halorussus gelatinilyticus]UPW01335.1 hypothetical protein M0R88_04330 [Halorussus gelatinilyticus]